jgi:hypothetical protein
MVLRKFCVLYQLKFEVLMNDDKDINTLFVHTSALFMILFTAVINSIFSKLECLPLSDTPPIDYPSGAPYGTPFCVLFSSGICQPKF